MSGLSRLRDWLLVYDPQLIRLIFAARSMVSLAVAAALCAAAAFGLGLHPTGILLGAVAAQLSTLLARERTRRDRILTCLVMIPGYWTGIVLLDAIAGHPWLDIAVLPLIIAAGFAAQALHAWLSTALLAAAWVYMFTLYLNVADQPVAWHMLAVTLGVLGAMVVRFVIWRDDRTLGRNLLLRSHRLILAAFAARAADKGAAPALLWLQGRMQPVSKAMIGHPRIDQATRSALSDLRLRVEAQVLHDPQRGGPIAALLRAGGRETDAPEIANAIHEVRSRAAAGNRRAGEGDMPAPASEGPSRAAAVTRGVQVLAAVAPATVLGHLVSDTRWLWAVLASMMLFFGTESSGHILKKGLGSVIGVTMGLLAGLVLADVIAATPVLEVAAIAILLFAAFYLIPVNYAVGMSAITVVLALVYQLTGQSVPSVLTLRFEEVLLGAAMGALAAAVVFPQSASTTLRRKAARFMDGAADKLDPDTAGPRKAVLRDMLGEVVSAADLGRVGTFLIDRSRTREALADMSRLLHLIEFQDALDPEAAHVDEAGLSRLAGRLRALAARLRSGQGDIPDGGSAATAGDTPATQALASIDATISRLAEGAPRSGRQQR